MMILIIVPVIFLFRCFLRHRKGERVPILILFQSVTSVIQTALSQRANKIRKKEKKMSLNLSA